MKDTGHCEDCRYQNHDNMQYAIWKPENIGFMLDGQEFKYIFDFLEKDIELPEIEFDEKKSRLVIALGTYSFQRDRKYKSKIDLITDYKGSAHITLTPKGWEYIELIDVKVHDDISKSDVPVSALIRTSLILPSSINGDMAITLFVRYADLSFVDNILNRPGHFEIKDSVENKSITDSNWLDFVKTGDVMKAHEYFWNGTNDDEHSIIS